MLSWRPRLATRIAFVIVISLIGIQFINLALFVLLPHPPVTLYRSDAVIDAAESLTRTIFELPPNARQAAIDRSTEKQWLDVNWRPEAPPIPFIRPALPELQLLEAALREKLSASTRSIFTIAFGPDWSPFGGMFEIMPKESIVTESQPTSHLQNRFVLPGIFGVAIEGQDGTWLLIGAKTSRSWILPLLPLTLGLFASGLLIAALSSFSASKIMHGLDKMAAAAERLGRERELTPISEDGLAEFSVIARSLNDMQLRIKRFIDERTRMIAAISHDLRTPLTRMKLSAEFIDDEAIRVEINQGIDRMRAMIEATLVFASHDAKGEPHIMTDVAAMIISIVDDVSDLGFNAQYIGPDHFFISCQPQMLRRAIANPLENAIKFGLSTTAELRAEGETVVVSIKDDGPGLPEDELETVMEPFYRVDASRNAETGGFGLGLSITKDIVNAHGGHISVMNGVPGGLCVRIELPLKIERPANAINKGKGG